MGQSRGTKRRRTALYVPKVDKEEERKEFNIIQKYRDLENEVQLDRINITRNGDVRIMSKRLEEIERLFGDLQSLNINKNAVLAQDSKAMKTLSDLLSLSMNSVKFDESSRLLKLNDILNGTKKFMLKDHFQASGVSEPEVQTLDQNDSDDETNISRSDSKGMSQNSVSDAAELKTRQEQSHYLSQFESFSDFNQFNWFKLGALYSLQSKVPFTSDHMLGPLYVEQKVRRPRELRNKDPIEAASTAERVTKERLNESQEESTPTNVKKCYKVLQKKNGERQINLFRFIIDPTSFAKSVENLFYTSFLIKEGRLVLEDDSEGFPAVRIKESLPDDQKQRELEKQRRKESIQNHIIFQMDVPTWRKLIEKFDIKEAFLNTDGSFRN